MIKENDNTRFRCTRQQPSAFVFASIRILRRFHLDAQRSSDQIEFLAKAAFQEALVRVSHMLQRITVDDDDRWIHTPLMGIPHLGPVHPRFFGGLELHRFQQQTGQNRRWHLTVRRFVGLRDGIPQGT